MTGLKRLGICLLACCCAGSISAKAADTRIVTDLAGRQVTVPVHVKTVYCMNPACAILVYTLAPERLVGWPIRMYPDETRFMAEPYGNLPVFGSLSNNTANIEEIARIHPDVVMFMAPGQVISMAERVQERTGIPAYLVNMTLDTMPQTYEALGDLLGLEARAAELGNYCRTTLDGITRLVKTIPVEDRPRVYCAQGPGGLQTFPAGAPHAQPIEFAGGINVAVAAMSLGTAQVSLEQLAVWNPQIVISVGDRASTTDGLLAQIQGDPVWKNIDAVKHHAVYKAPRLPFNWIDPPWSVNRVLGIQWLARLFHPDKFPDDMRAVAKDFYARFYHRTLTDSELNELLAGAVLRRPTK
jgi:iron complex transport system substrate-binding protein